MVVKVQCWEQCFQAIATEDNRDVLSEIYKTGNTIKRIKDINSANGITFLLDSSIANLCKESSSSSSSSESWENTLGNENATAIWQLQLNLMAIVTSMTASTLAYPVQFNENAAWSCNTLSCLGCCKVYSLIAGNYLTPVQVNLTSCEAGQLEPACRLAYHGLQSYSCTQVLKNNMTVAILNSKAYSRTDKRSRYSDYSPCRTYFPLRYAIGLHDAKHEDLVRFQSRENYHNYISDSLKMRTVASELVSCMSTACCSAPVGVSAPDGCNIAYAPAGETLLPLTIPPPP